MSLGHPLLNVVASNEPVCPDSDHLSDKSETPVTADGFHITNLRHCQLMFLCFIKSLISPDAEWYDCKISLTHNTLTLYVTAQQNTNFFCNKLSDYVTYCQRQVCLETASETSNRYMLSKFCANTFWQAWHQRRKRTELLQCYSRRVLTYQEQKWELRKLL